MRAHSHNVFSSYHPAVVLAFFIVAIVLGVLTRHPAHTAVGVACAATFLVSVRGRAAWRTIAAMIPLFALVALVNPVVNALGGTVLFTYLWGRPYTLEALLYGANVAGMIVALLLWFAGLNATLTSDRLMGLFGKAAPSVAMVVTMTLRFVPNFARKAGELSRSRASVGLSAGTGSLRNRLHGAGTILTMLTGWALERSVVTADSLRSRGWGLGACSTYQRFRPTARDRVFAAVLAVLACAAIVLYVAGVAEPAYFPAFGMAPCGPLFWPSLAVLALALLLPSAINVREGVLWRFSLCKI